VFDFTFFTFVAMLTLTVTLLVEACSICRCCTSLLSLLQCGSPSPSSFHSGLQLGTLWLQLSLYSSGQSWLSVLATFLCLHSWDRITSYSTCSLHLLASLINFFPATLLAFCFSLGATFASYSYSKYSYSKPRWLVRLIHPHFLQSTTYLYPPILIFASVIVSP